VYTNLFHVIRPAAEMFLQSNRSCFIQLHAYPFTDTKLLQNATVKSWTTTATAATTIITSAD